MDKQELKKLIEIWFHEDIRDGDATSLSCIPPTEMGCQQLIVKGYRNTCRCGSGERDYSLL